MKLIIFLGLFVFFGISCKKNNSQHPVPFVKTDFVIDISLPSYSELQNVGGYTFANGGSRGIIIYRKSQDEFVAWDRQSPNDPNGTCGTPLTPNTDNFLQLDDACSEGTYSLYDGAPLSNSEFGLRQYSTSFYSANQLRIYN